MAKAGNDPTARSARQRARLYQARRDFHASLGRRRRRDNLVAGIAGGMLVLALAGAQIAYFSVGPGSPAATPAPTATVTPGTTPVPTPSATDAATPSPSVSATP